MTIECPALPEARARDEAAEALELFDLASTILRKLLQEAQAELPGASARDFASTTKDISGALKTLVLERQHVERLRREAGDLAGDGAFDLQAARDEIGLRLACLRDAGGD